MAQMFTTSCQQNTPHHTCHTMSHSEVEAAVGVFKHSKHVPQANAAYSAGAYGMHKH
jgi:hypothetical protein